VGAFYESRRKKGEKNALTPAVLTFPKGCVSPSSKERRGKKPMGVSALSLTAEGGKMAEMNLKTGRKREAFSMWRVSRNPKKGSGI